MSQSISNPVRVAVVYHSGYGHTAKHAEAVARGAAASQDTKCVLIRVEEVDEYWEKFSAGGKKERCGWLKDKYGLSWQIIPNVLGRFLQEKDPAKSQRVMKAMMQMDKIDIKGLQRAHEQS